MTYDPCMSFCDRTHGDGDPCRTELVYLPDAEHWVSLIGRKKAWVDLEFYGAVLDAGQAAVLNETVQAWLPTIREVYANNTGDNFGAHTMWCQLTHDDGQMCTAQTMYNGADAVITLEADEEDVHVEMQPVRDRNGDEVVAGPGVLGLGMSCLEALAPALPGIVDTLTAVQHDEVDNPADDPADHIGPEALLRSGKDGSLTLFRDTHGDFGGPGSFFVTWDREATDWNSGPILDLLQRDHVWVLPVDEAFQLGWAIIRLTGRRQSYPAETMAAEAETAAWAQDWVGPIPLEYTHYPLPTDSGEWNDQRQGMLTPWLFWDREGMFVRAGDHLIVIFPGVEQWANGELYERGKKRNNRNGLIKHADHAIGFAHGLIELAEASPSYT